ncbi:transposase [Catellatospora sp. IY07-71]|uniref:IS4 family transposase n=1 Tax=Catellatospora sp. IY07-71 TaxID=2728827 RepID=UPI001BB44AEB|nr:IS4 family transposase [Catellatospora sp. IY07-71]BCJ70558.1 transposase [Catellatospora sp. IY07-71]BCJ73577.1 transposase [Catellatospora sp. IY07-71]BCJ73820.1 transposase [Catellatospora sp. IY07-71]BCJ74560.1 transposase [Catellatospora sp. IY07-71]BCJ77155.1 transposase [Catellatospora sp. IY07-71]
MQQQSAITRTITVAAGAFAPGHLGELTQVLDFDLVDAVAAETGTTQRRVRLLPTRVLIFFVLALALFEPCAYRQVWAKLVAGLRGLAVACPSASALTRARRRVGPKPLRALFEAVCGPVAWPTTGPAFWRGFRTVAVDATTLHVPDRPGTRTRYPKRQGPAMTFSYPYLRLVVLVECGTRALLGAAFGPESAGEHVYARRLLDKLDAGMLLLADAYYDSWKLLADIAATRVQYLCRSGAGRVPLILTRLSDGSYLSVLGHGRLKVRVIETWVEITHADGVVRTEQWRLITSLLDHTRYPAADLVQLYHQRWQVETTYLSIKSTILDERVLRSHHPADIDQELWALLTVYQTIIRITVDAVDALPDVDYHRASFTVALETARDQVVTAEAVIPPPGHAVLVGAIGQAVQDNLLPARRRQRAKARSRKNPTSKYGPNAGKHPQQTQTYTFHATVTIFEEGLTARSNP